MLCSLTCQTPNALYQYSCTRIPSSSSTFAILSTWLLPCQPRPLPRPSSPPHALLNSPPDSLDNLPIPPPPLLATRPLVHLCAEHTTSQVLNRLRRILALPPDIHTRVVTKQLGRIGVFVALELPRLARSKDGDNARPVCGLEAGRAVDEDECDGLRGDGRHWAADLDHVGAGGVGGIGGDEYAVVEEGFYVRCAQEGGGGGREQDDGLHLLVRLLGEVRDEGGLWCGGLVGVGARAEELGGGLAVRGEVLGLLAWWSRERTRAPYDWLVAAQDGVVVAHIPLAVVDLEESRVYHAALCALHVAVNRYTLPASNRGRIARCCRCGAAVDWRDAVTAFCLPTQPRDQLDLLREGQVLYTPTCAARQLLVQRRHRRKVVGDRGIFVHPSEVAAPQVDWLAVRRKARF